VVVCTRDRADSAIQTVLSFQTLEYEGDVEIIVIDNAPRDNTLAEALERLPDNPRRPVRRVVEPVPGLSRARNRALDVASGEIIAFTDDDAVAEPQWLRMLASGFGAAPDVAAVSGLTIPAEIETQAQDWAERFNGLNGGRGFARQEYRVGQLAGRHPLYPFPTIGAGVNMAFRRDVLRELGGFCPTLGVGTGTGGGEDTAIMAEVLLARHAIVYEPGAVVRHLHRRDEAGLRTQMRGYGIGVTAYLSWCLHKHPWKSLGMVKMAGHVAEYVRSRGASHQAPDRPPVPQFLRDDLRRGLPHGPWAYIRAVRHDRSLRV
jgi:glycosyltransferase involved in cell wall biosynthesis